MLGLSSRATLIARLLTFQAVDAVKQGWDRILEDTAAQQAREAEDETKFRYGELFFEETGSTVPYLVIPDTEEGHDPQTVVDTMIKHL